LLPELELLFLELEDEQDVDVVEPDAEGLLKVESCG
jgi:hypothetical protein